VYVEGKAAWIGGETEPANDVAVDDSGYDREGFLSLTGENSTEKVVLNVVVVIVFWDDDKLVGDQIFSCCACFLLWGLVVDVWVGLTKSVDVPVESPKDLNCVSVLGLR
jgi:hypothetical protein